jgi:hypothetical protein
MGGAVWPQHAFLPLGPPRSAEAQLFAVRHETAQVAQAAGKLDLRFGGILKSTRYSKAPDAPRLDPTELRGLTAVEVSAHHRVWFGCSANLQDPIRKRALLCLGALLTSTPRIGNTRSCFALGRHGTAWRYHGGFIAKFV